MRILWQTARSKVHPRVKPRSRYSLACAGVNVPDGGPPTRFVRHSPAWRELWGGRHVLFPVDLWKQTWRHCAGISGDGRAEHGAVGVAWRLWRALRLRCGVIWLCWPKATSGLGATAKARRSTRGKCESVKTASGAGADGCSLWRAGPPKRILAPRQTRCPRQRRQSLPDTKQTPGRAQASRPLAIPRCACDRSNLA